MDKRTLIKNVSVAFLAQGVSMLLSIVQSLIVPKLLGTEQYGYWQLFIFYIGYVGFFHLGLNDGVYLIKGGQSRDKIDRRSVNSQFVFALSFQLVMAVVIVAIAVLGGFGPEREFVIVCTGIFLVIQNAATYLTFLLQAMNETRLSSYSSIVERLSFLVPLLLLLTGRIHAFEPYVISYIFSSVVQLGFCLYLLRDFTKSGILAPSQAAREGIQSIRVGIKLMLANIASQLVLGIARFAIDATWGIKTFGELSLALSMVNFFLAFVSQASMVLFPALRQSSAQSAKHFYTVARDAMGLAFPAVYLLYQPMTWLLGLWLPQYAHSFVFFIYLMPLCVFDSKMNITCTTFFKVRREEAVLFRINACIALLSALGTFLGTSIFHSIYVIIGSVVLAIIIRSLYSESYLNRAIGVPPTSIGIWELVLTGAFVTMTILLPPLVATTAYLLFYVAFLVANGNCVQSTYKALRT
ncbi:lipopolysaccharide biosynthesis protein [Olsenella sp. DNF00959]|uniref:lipopolysaccharide biosynthesis protein n=1 Tax=Olsenella sp. DNF00959 TaxID=1476999 RepID=UPI0007845AA4|nr:oligosaccharide flippase family protein [Olsenella sp. DNF00959]KXB63955.1 polysaccharide biosynthesis protein [Olsenella sp. DNF00959]